MFTALSKLYVRARHMAPCLAHLHLMYSSTIWWKCQKKCGTYMYNYMYADDTSICCRGDNFEMACCEAEKCIEYMLNWFDVNHLKANPAKFQLIVFEKEFHPRAITVGNSMLTNQKCVKLLGINIDHELNFNGHILELCKKAGRKINVMARLSTHLDIQSKLTLFYSFILSHFQYFSSV